MADAEEADDGGGKTDEGKENPRGDSQMGEVGR